MGGTHWAYYHNLTIITAAADYFYGEVGHNKAVFQCHCGMIAACCVTIWSSALDLCVLAETYRKRKNKQVVWGLISQLRFDFTMACK